MPERYCLKLGLKKEIDEICGIIANHHSPGKINTTNFKVLYDADCLVNLKEEVGVSDKLKADREVIKKYKEFVEELEGKTKEVTK